MPALGLVLAACDPASVVVVGRAGTRRHGLEFAPICQPGQHSAHLAYGALSSPSIGFQRRQRPLR